MDAMNSRAASRLTRGMLLQGRYRIQQLIGSGGMSYVYAANDERLMGKQWAIKESIPLGVDRDHLIREMKWLTALHHPNLPHIVDFFAPDQDGHAYLVMELVDGVTLMERMKQKGISFQDVVSIAIQLCDALHYLHRQDPPIIYRDLKPSNVMICADGSFKLIDFGIARQLKADSLADTVKLGTIGFAAPEQYEGLQSDARTDLYAVGALLAYMLTDGKWNGNVPLREELMRVDTSKGFHHIINKLLSIKPDDRYASALELMNVLRDFDASYTTRHSDHNGQPHIHTDRYNNHSQGKVIALLGSAPGLGTTHTALSIAYAAARLYKGKVAYVDAAGIDSLTIPSLYSYVEGEQWEEAHDEAASFTWNGVCHISMFHQDSSTMSKLVAQLQAQFQLIVLDLGSGMEDYRLVEFMRAEASGLIGTSVPWRHAGDELPLERIREHEYTRWSYLIPHHYEAHIRQHRAYGLCARVIGFPNCPDPFRGSIQLDQWVEKWLQTTISLYGRRRFRSWFRRMPKQQEGKG